MRFTLISLHAATMCLAAAVMLWIGAAPQPAQAQFLSDYYRKIFVMPGPVIKGHAAFEQNCAKCHVRENYTTLPNKLCLSCHKSIALDMDQIRGMHGRRVDIHGARCVSCHSDHKGRAANIIGLDRELFNHDLTDFKLVGPHGAQVCSQCHGRAEKFRKARSRCVDCHGKAVWKRSERAGEVAAGRIAAGNRADGDTTAGDRAAGVSVTRDTATRKADRSGELSNETNGKTRMGVSSGSQKKPDTQGGGGLTVAAGPGPRQFRSGKTSDPHFGRLPDCELCHKVSNWNERRPFDHARISAKSPRGRFSLIGQHAKATCASCHAGEYYRNIARRCVSCHILQDNHAGNFGRSCNLCHGQENWKINLVARQAGRAPRLPPGGGKLDHSKSAAQSAGMSTAISILRKIDFDHSKTGFALIGQHKSKAKCESCHKKSFSNTPKTCSQCHKKNDVHKGLLGRSCETCHSPMGFTVLNRATASGTGTTAGAGPLREALQKLQRARFDHSTTKFALIGNHKTKAKCEACHKSSLRRTPQKCISCHEKKDAHKGRYGRQCQACHSPTGWKIFGGRGDKTSLREAFKLLRKAKFDHSKTRFRLRGRHRRAACEKCHKTTFKGTPRDCYSCHKREGRNAHGRRAAGRYRNCGRCHSTRRW